MEYSALEGVGAVAYGVNGRGCMGSIWGRGMRRELGLCAKVRKEVHKVMCANSL